MRKTPEDGSGAAGCVDGLHGQASHQGQHPSPGGFVLLIAAKHFVGTRQRPHHCAWFVSYMHAWLRACHNSSIFAT